MGKKGALLFFLGVTLAAAQNSSGYVFAAPGGVSTRGYTSMTIHAGIGGDILLAKGLGINMELGVLGPREDYSAALGVFSVGGVFYPRRKKELKVQPFGAAGYTVMFREGHGSLFYFGGGTNVWCSRHLGVRLELRDHVDNIWQTYHYWGVRFGLAFR